MAKKADSCTHCASTGILRATLVKNSGGGGSYIEVVVCGGHYNNEAAERTMAGMHAASGLAINVFDCVAPHAEK